MDDRKGGGIPVGPGRRRWALIGVKGNRADASKRAGNALGTSNCEGEKD